MTTPTPAASVTLTEEEKNQCLLLAAHARSPFVDLAFTAMERGIAIGLQRAAAPAIDRAPVVEADAWISVEERLPPKCVTVIGYWPMASSFATVTYTTHWHNPEDDEDDYAMPSHWMSLPPAPEGS